MPVESQHTKQGEAMNFRGFWFARKSLDGSRAPCGAAVAFQMVQAATAVEVASAAVSAVEFEESFASSTTDEKAWCRLLPNLPIVQHTCKFERAEL